MDLLPPLLSIVVLAALASGANLLLHNRLKICPVCAGVFGTWLWMLVAHLFGVPVNVTVAALLLGGSVVGITTKLESRFPENRAKVVWKLLPILLGMVAAYGLMTSQSVLLVFGLIADVALTWIFLPRPSGGRTAISEARRQDLEQKMKHCC